MVSGCTRTIAISAVAIDWNEGIVNSKLPAEAQRLYRRLIATVPEFGRGQPTPRTYNRESAFRSRTKEESAMSEKPASAASQPTRLTGAEIVWATLEGEGVRQVFGYPGGAILPVYDALRKYPDSPHPGAPRAGRRPHGRRICPRLRRRSASPSPPPAPAPPTSSPASPPP